MLVRAYQLDDRPNEGILVIQEMVRRSMSSEEATKLMQFISWVT